MLCLCLRHLCPRVHVYAAAIQIQQECPLGGASDLLAKDLGRASAGCMCNSSLLSATDRTEAVAEKMSLTRYSQNIGG